MFTLPVHRLGISYVHGEYNEVINMFVVTIMKGIIIIKH
jgi:hypothetical protein